MGGIDIKASLTLFFKNGLTDSKLLYIAFISVFLPFYITATIIVLLTAYIVFTNKAEGLFHKNCAPWLIVFAIYSAIIAVCNLNYIGLFCSVAFVCLMAMSLYARKVFNITSFERCLNICCIGGFVTSIFIFIDYAVVLMNTNYNGGYRATLYFFNCNYLATILATVIIICGYKILLRKPKAYLYYIAAIFCAAGTYLTGSMFVWVEVFIGAAALLFLMRKGQMLSVLLLLAGTALIVIYCIPSLIPRLNESNITTDNRVIIWLTSLSAIVGNPLFGRGFLTYYHIYENFSGSYPTTHAHNIMLEPVLSFGVFGTVLLVIYFICYFKRVITCRNAQSKLKSSSLILALTLALLVHSTTDLTFLWIQTGLLFCLLMGGIGIEERMLKIE